MTLAIGESTDRHTPQVSWNRDSQAPDLLRPDLSPWTEFKEYADLMAGQLFHSPLLRLRRMATDMRRCGSRLVYRRVTCEGEDQLRLVRWWACGLRGCPICEVSILADWQARLAGAFPGLCRDHPGCRWISLTLPYPAIPVFDLRTHLTRMDRAFSRFVGRKLWPGNGWIRVVRIEGTEEGLAKPSFHVLVLVCPCCSRTQEIPPSEVWTDLWAASLRQKPSLDVSLQVFPSRIEEADKDLAGLKSALEAALCPLICDEGWWTREKVAQLHGKQLVSASRNLAARLREHALRGPGWVRNQESYRLHGDELAFRWRAGDFVEEDSARGVGNALMQRQGSALVTRNPPQNSLNVC